MASGRRRGTEWADLSTSRSRAYVFIAVSVLAIAILLYTNSLIRRLEAQAATLSRSLAGLCASATYAARENEELRAIFTELIQTIDFPIVITDVRGVPITWKGTPVDLDPEEVSHRQYLTADYESTKNTRFGEVFEFVGELDSHNAPIPMTRVGDDQVHGYIHYGESSMIREIRFLPAVELLAFGVLVFLGFMGFRNAKLAELRSIWVGMARETAHQLGTPISSMMGWVELIRELAKSGCPSEKIADMTGEMQRDLERLEKISLRFNQIGSIPKTKREDVVVVLREVVDYLRRRAEALRKDVTIEERYEHVPQLEVNRELLEWVVENLVKNSIEALGPEGGRIEVSTEHLPKQGQVRILVTDSGRGFSPAEKRRVFQPGYSTKRKGWGLGLALSRRIVEDYHKGRLSVPWTEPGKGTTFAITLPIS
ncbi:MAG: two-component sensor histidine kinase [Candidatus Eisenbacteria bacterium]|nr:two-component sensor histidine kinase [Candidatus Eisenbacteria bacterium]